MIIVLISVAVLIVGIACMVIEEKSRRYLFWVGATGIVASLVAGMAGLVMGIMICDTQINRDVRYQNKIYEKQMLEYRIEKIEDNIIGNEKLYNDIVEFNNDIR